MAASEAGDHTRATALLGRLPAAEWLITDRGHDVDWFRDALERQGDTPLPPQRAVMRED